MNHLYQSEIWTKTNCLSYEESTNQRLFGYLTNQGYTQTDHFRIWKKEDQTVIVCLVDDIQSCSTDYHTDTPYLFDCNTTVITDNYLTCPSRFKVINLPVSFFGIYSYTPGQQSWTPDRDFAFQVNRIDLRRFRLMVDLAWRANLDSGYVNFNCEDRLTHLAPQVAFEQCWISIPDEIKSKYHRAYSNILEFMPYKNYDLSFDRVPLKSWINIVVETYSSDNVITLSEKIFRALVTPAPWTVYSGRYTVAHLESLGFDCMSDIINHNHYDRLKEVENKIQIFNWKSLEIVNDLKQLGVETVRQRCVRASQHNQIMLQKYADQKDQDFIQYLSTLVF